MIIHSLLCILLGAVLKTRGLEQVPIVPPRAAPGPKHPLLFQGWSLTPCRGERKVERLEGKVSNCSAVLRKFQQQPTSPSFRHWLGAAALVPRTRDGF